VSWQRCPVCCGHGMAGLFKCPTCHGHRIIDEMTGKPPGGDETDEESCGAKIARERVVSMTDKFQTYLSLLPTQQDINGFIQTDTCDSLLFSCLVGCVPGVDFNPWPAFESASTHSLSGQWYRRPHYYAECLSCGGSNSTLSRDMVLGLLWYAWVRRDLNLSESILRRALPRLGFVGKSDGSWAGHVASWLPPGLLATAAEVSARLGGPQRRWLRWIPQFESPNVTGYEAHLSVLHQLLRKRLTGEPVKYHHAENQPQNPLFCYAAGYMATAQNFLDNENWWPADRLPTTADRADPWIIQRDVGPDWQPSAEQPPQTHTGGDLLFVQALVDGLI
jgi:hypothetical protein